LPSLIARSLLSEVEPPELTLGVRRAARRTLAAVEHGFEADAVQSAGRRDLREVEHSWRDIHVTHLLRHARSRSHVRTRDHERHAKRRIVDEDTVFGLAVLAQALAVIRGDDHECPVGPRLERAHDLAEGPVAGRDLALVRMPGILLGERGRRIVGRMRIVEVDPEKEGALRALEPRDRIAGDLGRAPLKARQ